MPSMNRLATRAARLRLLPIVMLALPCCLWAQGGTGDNGRQVACERARTGLSRRTSTEEVRRSISNVQECPAIAVTALSETWNAPPNDTVALRLLGEVSGQIADRRLLRSATGVATDSRRSLDERLAAFRTLVAHAAPGTVLLFRNLEQPGLPGVGYVMMGQSAHSGVVNGPEALTASDRSAALDTLKNLGATDPDPTIKAIAAHLAERLATST